MTCTLLDLPPLGLWWPVCFHFSDHSFTLSNKVWTSNFDGTFSGTLAVVPIIALHYFEYDMSAEQVGRQQQIKVELVCRVCNFCDFHRIHSLSPSRLQFLPCIPPVWIPDPRSQIPDAQIERGRRARATRLWEGWSLKEPAGPVSPWQASVAGEKYSDRCEGSDHSEGGQCV